jgi:signal transduction histidine kinase
MRFNQPTRWHAAGLVAATGLFLVFAAWRGNWQPLGVVALFVSLAYVGSRCDRATAIGCGLIGLAAAAVAITIDGGVSGVQALQSMLFIAVAPLGGYVIARTMQRKVELERLQAGIAIAETKADVAREVHDITSHALMAVITQLRVASKGIDKQEPTLIRQGVDAAGRSAADALQELRLLTAVLVGTDHSGPQASSIAGLVEEMERACAGYPQARFIPPIGTAERSVDVNVAATALRVVQQCLANAAAHAPNATVQISASADANRLTVRSTNGVPSGISPGPGMGLGLGLSNMEKRAKDVGGSLTTGLEDGQYVVTLDVPTNCRGPQGET